MNIYDELQWRGLVSDCTDAVELNKRLAAGPITLYAGFDPTADSLHVGSLVPLLVLRRFQMFGHHPIAVAGGATGSVGDPSGKSAERQLLTREVLTANIAGIKPQLARWLDFNAKTNPARLVDNADWTAPVSYLDFLREVGKHFSVNMMVAKESVRARMEDREAGISYTEFSYMLLQAFDFYHLGREFNCELQVGGSDQWGNITAGIDLCRKKLGRHVFGLTQPLITRADGTKFGKTEAGTVWLDTKRTSVYRFYQFWVNTDDRDVERYLKLFTFLRLDRIAAALAEHAADPGLRVAQRLLAREVTATVHGEEAAAQAIETAAAMFGGGGGDLARAELPERVVSRSELPGEIPIVDLLVASGLAASKGDARRGIQGRGFYLNDQAIDAVDLTVGEDDLQGPSDRRFVILRKGKKNYVRLVLTD